MLFYRDIKYVEEILQNTTEGGRTDKGKYFSTNHLFEYCLGHDQANFLENIYVFYVCLYVEFSEFLIYKCSNQEGFINIL